jgi:hypothetical protein
MRVAISVPDSVSPKTHGVNEITVQILPRGQLRHLESCVCDVYMITSADVGSKVIFAELRRQTFTQ